MRDLIWTKTFARAIKRTINKNPAVREDIEKTLRLLTENPFGPQIGTHKLKGKLFGAWACNFGYDLRLIFEFVKNDSDEEDDILLLAIGTHDEVY